MKWEDEVKRRQQRYPDWTTWQCELAADESWSRQSFTTGDKEAQLAEIMRLAGEYAAEYTPCIGDLPEEVEARAALESAVRKALGL